MVFNYFKPKSKCHKKYLRVCLSVFVSVCVGFKQVETKTLVREQTHLPCLTFCSAHPPPTVQRCTNLNYCKNGGTCSVHQLEDVDVVHNSTHTYKRKRIYFTCECPGHHIVGHQCEISELKFILF